MSYQDDMNALIANNYISYVIIMQPTGEIYWSNNPNWAVNGTDVIRQWMTRAPSINIGGVKFSSFRNDPGEVFVGRNMAGGGLAVLQKARNGYIFLTWTSSEFLSSSGLPPLNVASEVARMALKFG